MQSLEAVCKNNTPIMAGSSEGLDWNIQCSSSTWLMAPNAVNVATNITAQQNAEPVVPQIYPWDIGALPANTKEIQWPLKGRPPFLVIQEE